MKRKITQLISIFLVLTLSIGLLSGVAVFATETSSIYDLRVNDLIKPIGVDDTTPAFSWKMASDAIGAKQTAYSIVVKEGETEAWNTGWVTSDASNGVNYAGSSLKASTRYTYTVSIKDQNGDVASAESYFETGLMGAISDAKWISFSGSSGNTNSLPVFRKSFTTKTVKSAKLYTSALGIYEAYINGQRLGRLLDDGTTEYHVLKPGYTEPQKRKFYSSYDVTHMLTSNGANAISAEVSSGWWSGGVVNLNKGSVDAFWAKLIVSYTDGTTDTIVTDTSWKTSRQSPVQKSSGIFPGEKYDARISTDWRNASFDDSAWLSPVINTEYTGELVAYDGEYVTVRDDLELEPKNIYVYSGATGAVDGEAYGKVNVLRTYNDGDTIVLNSGETLVVDFGQNFAGWEAFNVSAQSGTTIHVEHGEMLNEGNGLISRGADGPEGSVYNTNYRSNIANTDYITSGNEVETYHPTHTYYGFSCMALTATNTATFTNIRGQVVTSVKEDTATMTTANEDVNKLISNVTWSMYSNYLSVPTDCPQRTERMGWTGDAQIFAEAGSYLGNNKSFMEKYITDMRDVQIKADEVTTGKPLGAYSTIAPTGSYSSTSWGDMGWADAGIIIPYYVYMMYGDTETISNHWDSMVSFMDDYLGSTEGLGGKKSYGDHMHYERNDDATKPLLAISYYAWDALMMSEMAEALGKTADAEKYMQVYEAEKALYQEKYVNTNGTLKFNVQTLLLYALFLDLLPNEESVQAVTNQLVTNIENNGNKLKTGFLGTSIIMHTLSKVGRTDLAYKLLLQHNCPSWLYTVDNGATSIWERWDAFTEESGIYGGSATNNAKSFNHYSFGAVISWMYRTMAGIGYDKENPGFKHIILAPQPSLRLPVVNASYDSAYGTIVSNMSYGDEVWNYSCTVPANTTATIKLPVADVTTLKVGTKSVSTDAIDGLTYVGCENGIATIEAVAGSYDFTTYAETKQTVNLDVSVDKSVPISAYEIKLNGEVVSTAMPASITVEEGDVVTAKVIPNNDIDYAVTEWTIAGETISEDAELSYTVEGGESVDVTAEVGYIGYENIAVGATVDAAAVNTSWPASHLTDGNLNSLAGGRGWSSTKQGKSTTFDAEVSAIIDLGSVKNFNRFQIYPRDYQMTTARNFPVDYKIYVSNDKSDWKEVYSVEGATAPDDVYTPQVVQLNRKLSAQYIKLGVTKITQGDEAGNCYVQLAEMGVYYNEDQSFDPNVAKGANVYAFMDATNIAFSNSDTTIGNGISAMVDGDDDTFAFIKRHNYSSHLAVVDLGEEVDIAKIRIKAPTKADMQALQEAAGLTKTNVNDAACLFVSSRVPTMADFNGQNVASGVTDVIKVNTDASIGGVDKTYTGIGTTTTEHIDGFGKYRYVGVFVPYSYGIAINSLEVYPMPYITAEFSGDKIVATPYDLPDGCKVIMACYDDEILTECTVITYDGSYSLEYTPVNPSYDSVMVFAFESFDSIMPLCEAPLLSK